MAGKTKEQKKKRAKVQKRNREELRRLEKAQVPKIRADQEDDVLGNNAEVAPNPNPEPEELDRYKKADLTPTPEDLLRQAEERRLESEVVEDEIMANMVKAADLALKRVEEMEIEEPFDPMSVVNKALGKTGD